MFASAAHGQACLDDDDAGHIAAHVGLLSDALSIASGSPSPNEAIYAMHVPGMSSGKVALFSLFMPCSEKPVVYDRFCETDEDGVLFCSRLACPGEAGDWIERVLIGNPPVATEWNGAMWIIDQAMTRFRFDATTGETAFFIDYDIAEGDGDRWQAAGRGTLLHDSYHGRIELSGLLGGADVTVAWMGDAFLNLQGLVRSANMLLGTLSRDGGAVAFQPVPSCM
jgi:hypothetical protein